MKLLILYFRFFENFELSAFLFEKLIKELFKKKIINKNI
jgi:hypothetical protein